MKTKDWSINKNTKMSSCSAWPKWYIGFSNGHYGLGIVRESWGWRIMVGKWDLCKWVEKRNNHR